jgi:hypothetical protein
MNTGKKLLLTRNAEPGGGVTGTLWLRVFHGYKRHSAYGTFTRFVGPDLMMHGTGVKHCGILHDSRSSPARVHVHLLFTLSCLAIAGRYRYRQNNNQ